MIRAAAALSALLFSLASTAAAEGSDFDFYVLSLSWSPTWCATAPDAEDSAQCDADANFGFVVHGLWPQYESGYPEFCGGNGELSQALIESVIDIMPDRDLVAHEWRKHGACSGMSPEAYLAKTREALGRVRLPGEFTEFTQEQTLSAEAVEAAFVERNPGLAPEQIAVSCRNGFLEEVRICLTRDLAFRACPEVDARGCRSRNLRLPPAD